MCAIDYRTVSLKEMTVKWTVKRHALGKPLTCQKRKHPIPRVLKEPRRLLLSGQVTIVRIVNYCQDSKLLSGQVTTVRTVKVQFSF